MKPLALLLLAVLLCGSALAAEDLAGARQVLAAQLAKSRAEVFLPPTKTTVPRETLTLLQVVERASTRGTEWHAPALKKLRTEPAFAAALAKHRAAVAALPQTAETRTYLATVLDPVIKGLASPPNDAFVGDLARLRAALEVKS